MRLIRLSLTSSGMSMYLSMEASCWMMGLQNMEAKSSGLAGSFVTGFSGGARGSGRSAARLYHLLGISSGSRVMRASFGIAIMTLYSAFIYVHNGN